MGKRINLIGQRFGRLLVRGEIGASRAGIRWLCDCDCGGHIAATIGHLRNSTRSCGCLKREKLELLAPVRLRSNLRHGNAGRGKKTRTYHSWEAMIQRCTNPNTKAYKHYGGRGITICASWRESFEAFLTDMGERPAGTTLDRRENDGDYEKDNCRWATKEQQITNRRPYRPRRSGSGAALIG